MFRAPYSFDGHRLIKVTIEYLKPSTQDALGAPSTDWLPYAKDVPMAFENLDGDERLGDQQIEAVERWELLCRYMRLPEAPAAMRVSFSRDGLDALMDITSVKNPGMQNRWLLLRAKSGVNRG